MTHRGPFQPLLFCDSVRKHRDTRQTSVSRGSLLSLYDRGHRTQGTGVQLAPGEQAAKGFPCMLQPWSPGSRRLPVKFQHPRKLELPEWPVRALLLCAANPGEAGQRTPEPASHGSNVRSHPRASAFREHQAHHHIRQRAHLHTYFISALHILAPALQPIHNFLFMLWTSRFSMRHTSYQPSKITATTMNSVAMHTKRYFSPKA